MRMFYALLPNVLTPDRLSSQAIVLAARNHPTEFADRIHVLREAVAALFALNVKTTRS
jgi:hypothetical protein